MAANTIALEGSMPVVRNKTGTGTIYPGMLLELTAAAATIGVHTNAGDVMGVIVALEDSLQGEDVDHAYTTGEYIRYGHFKSGDVLQMRLANGETATLHCYLESNGDGYLRVRDADPSAGTIDPGSIKLMALEAVDMSGSTGEDPADWIQVLVL